MKSRASRSGGSLITVLCLILTVVVALPAAANHGRRTLQVRPESASLELGATHTLIAEVSREVTVSSGTVNIDFENENGPNDTDGRSFTSPDLTCSIPAGEIMCTVSYTGTIAGRDVWTAWIDHDGRDGTVEADRAELRNEVNGPGNGGTNCGGIADDGEPDCTDVVEVLWGSGRLDCDDAGLPDTERNTNPAGGGAVSNEDYSCTLTTVTGNPDAGATIKAEVINGINDPDATDGASYDSPDYTCTTGDAGGCVITVTQNEAEAGTAQVCFWVGTAAEGAILCSDESVDENQESDGSDAGNDLSDTVEKTWEVRVASGVDAEPETATTGFGTHEITATVYDQFGAVFNDPTTVSFEFFRGSPSDTDRTSPWTPDLACTTVNSTCSVTYTQSETPGTDLICVWVGDRPKTEHLTANNNNGLCDGEGLVDEDDEPGNFDRPEPGADNVDVVQKIWQNPTSAVALDCTPEDQSARRNTSPQISCRATDSAGAAVAGAEIDVEASGANDPDEANAPSPPDFSCVTNVTGTCSVSHGPRGEGLSEQQGTTVYRAWIDADNDNATVEADLTEGLNETTTPGGAEPDATDVVQIAWTSLYCDIAGTEGPDRLVGTSRGETICGLGGRDRILAGGGNDRVLGDAGNDEITGNKGGDRLEGGSGADRIGGSRGHDNLKGNGGHDRLDGSRGSDRCRGGAGNDKLFSCER